jgi:hypothetical protein
MSVSRVNIGGNTVGLVDLEEIFQEVKEAGFNDKEQLKGLILDKVTSKNYIPSKMVPIYREDLYEEFLVFTGELVKRRSSSSAQEVRLFGACCSSCEKIDGMIKNILTRENIGADYQHITDMREIARAGIMGTPAVMVNGSIILSGHVPAENQLERMLLAAIKSTYEDKY